MTIIRMSLHSSNTTGGVVAPVGLCSHQTVAQTDAPPDSALTDTAFTPSPVGASLDIAHNGVVGDGEEECLMGSVDEADCLPLWLVMLTGAILEKKNRAGAAGWDCIRKAGISLDY